MIVIEGVAARRPPLALASVSLAWEAGVHSLVGARNDGGPLLLELLAGTTRPRAGRVRVLGGSPTDADVRRQVAHIPLSPALPDALRVGETLALAAELRDEPALDPAGRLALLGVEALAERRVPSLSRAEARAVALAEGLTSTRVRVLLVDEPLVTMDPRAAGCLAGVLRARAREGRAIVVCTASARDAGEVADDHTLLREGAVVGAVRSLDELATLSPGGAWVRLVAHDGAGARAIVGALARAADVTAVESREATVRVRGRDALALARAIAGSVLEAGIDVIELRLEPPSLDQTRAGIAAPAAGSAL